MPEGRRGTGSRPSERPGRAPRPPRPRSAPSGRTTDAGRTRRGGRPDPDRDEQRGAGRAGSRGGTRSQRPAGLTGRAAILLLVLAALVVSYASSLRAWADQQARIAELRTEVAERERRVKELDAELERWQDPAYVEAQARERFGWVMPGEIGYVVVDGDEGSGEGEQETPGDGGEDAEHPAWWRTLWGSVRYAGDPPPKPEPPPEKPTPAKTIGPD